MDGSDLDDMQPEEEPEVAPRKSNAGRPKGSGKLQLTDELLRQIEGLGRIQCTMREAAAVLHVHADTYSDFLHAHEKAMVAWVDARETGKASLRRMQYKGAESGNITMQIWLGKQMLGQTDQMASTVNAGDGFSALLGALTGTVLPDHANGESDDK